MSSQTNNPETTLSATAALSPYRLVDRTGVHCVASGVANPLGVCQETVASGALARVRRLSAGTCKITAAGAIKVGQRCYTAAAGKISTSRAGRYVGRALSAATADLDVIEVDTQAREGGCLLASVAASAAVTNTTVETAFDKSITLPVDELQPGDELIICGQVIATATHSTDTLNIKVKIGTTILAASGAVDVADNDVCVFTVRLKVRTDGASGTLIAEGTITIGVEGTATLKAFKLASTAVDTTATQALTVTATWSVADAGNSCRLDDLSIERITD